MKQEYFYRRDSPSVPLEFPKLVNAQPSNFGPLRIFRKKKIYLMIAYSVLCWVLSWFTTCMDLKCKMHLLWVWVLIEKIWNPGSFAFKATCCPFVTLCQCLKILKKSHFVNKCLLWILAFSTNFCPIKTDLSGISVWPQALGFQKLAKLDRFWHF